MSFLQRIAIVVAIIGALVILGILKKINKKLKKPLAGWQLAVLTVASGGCFYGLLMSSLWLALISATVVFSGWPAWSFFSYWEENNEHLKASNYKVVELSKPRVTVVLAVFVAGLFALSMKLWIVELVIAVLIIVALLFWQCMLQDIETSKMTAIGWLSCSVSCPVAYGLIYAAIVDKMSIGKNILISAVIISVVPLTGYIRTEIIKKGPKKAEATLASKSTSKAKATPTSKKKSVPASVPAPKVKPTVTPASKPAKVSKPTPKKMKPTVTPASKPVPAPKAKKAKVPKRKIAWLRIFFCAVILAGTVGIVLLLWG